jgi:hypothetical protein
MQQGVGCNEEDYIQPLPTSGQNKYIHTLSPLVCFRQPKGKHCEPLW